MYKVVETIETDCGKSLSAVPNGWEVNGILSWPPEGSNITGLRKNPRSVPNDDWSKHKCTVKRNKIKNLSDALTIEKELALYSDTEDEHTTTIQKKYDRLHPGQRLENNNANGVYESMVLNLISDTNTTGPSQLVEVLSNKVDLPAAVNNVIQHQSSVSNDEISVPVDVPIIDMSFVIPNNEFIERFDQVEIDITRIENKMDDFIKQNMENNARIETKLDNLIRQQNSFHVSFQSFLRMAQSKSGSADDEEKQNHVQNIMELLPIKDQKSIEELENRISVNEEFGGALVEILAKVGGTNNNKATPMKIFYGVIDTLLSFDFVAKCSWTGSTRGPNAAVKIMFKGYTHIIKCVYKAVLLAKPAHTQLDNEDYFKALLRNGKRR